MAMSEANPESTKAERWCSNDDDGELFGMVTTEVFCAEACEVIRRDLKGDRERRRRTCWRSSSQGQEVDSVVQENVVLVIGIARPRAAKAFRTFCRDGLEDTGDSTHL